MSDLLDLLSRASLLGLVLVATFSGLQRGRLKDKDETITGLRGDIGDLEKRVTARDAELADEKRERAEEKSAQAEKVSELETTVDVLTATVTGEVHLVALTDQLEDHHAKSMAALDEVKRALRELREETQ